MPPILSELDHRKVLRLKFDFVWLLSYGGHNFLNAVAEETIKHTTIKLSEIVSPDAFYSLRTISRSKYEKNFL